ncbi:MAG: hypothetical protein RLN76_05640 [Phycisphaeraceae bacterium]
MDSQSIDLLLSIILKFIQILAYLLFPITTIAGVYLYYFPRKFKSLSAFHISKSLLDTHATLGNHQVDLVIDDNRIESIQRDHLVIWNSGSVPISKEDIPDNYQVCIVAPSGSRCLSAVIVGITNQYNEIHIEDNSRNTHILKIVFNFLDPGDGFYIDVLHNGLKPVELIFPVKGIPQGVNCLKNYMSGQPLQWLGEIKAVVKVIFLLMFFCGALIAVLLLSPKANVFGSNPEEPPAEYVIGLVFLLLFIFIMCTFTARWIKSFIYAAKRMPFRLTELAYSRSQ